MKHPIREEPVFAFVCTDKDAPHKWRAFFTEKFPIFFGGETKDEAIAKAEEFREKTIRENEASYSARLEALKKARRARIKKKEVRSEH